MSAWQQCRGDERVRVVPWRSFTRLRCVISLWFAAGFGGAG